MALFYLHDYMLPNKKQVSWIFLPMKMVFGQLWVRFILITFYSLYFKLSITFDITLGIVSIIYDISGLAVDNNTVVTKWYVDDKTVQPQFMWNISLSHHQVRDSCNIIIVRVDISIKNYILI